MSEYWISDSEGRVLGPVGLSVLKDLIGAGRLGSVTRVSRDGKTWAPLQSVPELVQAGSNDAAEARRDRQRADARKLMGYLEGLRTMPAHEVFRVARDAPLEVYREAFFKLSKKFHPDVVPKDADPQLREACAVAFRFFSGLMARVENGLARPPPKAPPPPTPPPPPAAPAPVAPAYAAEEFVGLKSLGPGLAQARIRVTRQNVGMFTEHPLMNLQRGSFFLTDERVLPLGTVVALTFSFDDPEYVIIARGKVAWEDAGRGNRAHGFGITFQDLTPSDREFIQSFARRHHG